MDGARISRIKEAIAGGGAVDPTSYPQRVCSAALDLLDVTGVGLSLMTNSRLGAVWASDPVAASLEDIQLTLGEGPTMDALRWTSPVLEPYLGAVSTRWPFFRPAALDLGIEAVLAFPLQMGVIRLGALHLSKTNPGLLTDDCLADALVLVDMAAQGILDLQAEGTIYWNLFDPVGERARVHHAAGIISAQLRCDLATAMACLRAYSFSTERSIYDVADDVIVHRLHLSPHSVE
jgi:hypothetical protein